MSTVEDRLHSAIRETAAEIPPGSIPPLWLPGSGQRAGHLQRSGRPARPGWHRAAAPLAAAAAVVAVIATVVALTSSDGSRTPAPGAGGAPTAAAALASVPPHYVTLTGSTPVLSEHLHAVVRSTVTGKVLATVSPPRPYRTFSWVSGAADDQTFVLAAQRYAAGASGRQNINEPTKFFRLRADPATGAAALTALPISEKPGYRVIGTALSPDGSKLAVALSTPQNQQQSRKIQVFTVATGAERDWTWTGPGWVGTQSSFGQPLSWAADSRTLAFQQWTGDQLSVRLLDTSAAGSSLRSARAALTMVASNNSNGNALLTPDGTRIVYVRERFPGNEPYITRVDTAVTEFSVRTGHLLSVRDHWLFAIREGSIPDQQVLWTSSSGSTLIVKSPPGTNPAGQVVHHPIQPILGVLRGNHFTPIPGSPTAIQNIEDVAW